jgi:hypothetical protein
VSLFISPLSLCVFGVKEKNGFHEWSLRFGFRASARRAG